jgi:hypothetical protein
MYDGPYSVAGGLGDGEGAGKASNGLGVAAWPNCRSRKVVPRGVSWKTGQIYPQKTAATFS